MDGKRELLESIENKLVQLKFNATRKVAEGIYDLFEKESQVDESIVDRLDEYVEKLAGNGTLVRLQLDDSCYESNGPWRALRRSRVYSERITSETLSLDYHPKDEETMTFLESILVKDIPFGFMNPEQKTRLIESMKLVEVEAGTFITQEGGFGSQMYIVEDGEFEVSKGGMFLRKLYRGNFFGEIALLHNIPRTAEIKATVSSKVWVVEQTAFTGIRMMDRIANKKIILEGLKKHKIFAFSRDEDYKDVLDSLSFVYYKAGSWVEMGESEFFMSLFDGEINDGTAVKEVKSKDIIRSGFTAITVIQGTCISSRQVSSQE